MGGHILTVGNLKERKNFVPLPYRSVSFQPYTGDMTTAAIERYLLAREVYRRTDVIVLHTGSERFAVAAVQRLTAESLFSPVEKVEVLALPDECVFLEDPTTDPGNRSALAALAVQNGVTDEQTAIVLGAFDHVNIIHHPDPLTVRVVEVTPPEPPKLYRMVEQVLGYADLPPITVELERIDLVALCETVDPAAYLVPCRSGGLTGLNAPVYFLDERPPTRQNWTLIGCERSLQFHRHYYGDEPPRVEMCPRRIAGTSQIPTLLKCCLLEYETECEARRCVVPWGADLGMVECALRQLAERVEYD